MDSSTLYYTYSLESGSGASNRLIERFSDFGAISAVTSDNGTAAVGGILYMETVIEFCEFCPIVTTSPSATLALTKKMKKQIRSRLSAEDPEQKLERLRSKRSLLLREIECQEEALRSKRG
jgi:hypothetical protein